MNQFRIYTIHPIIMFKNAKRKLKILKFLNFCYIGLFKFKLYDFF